MEFPDLGKHCMVQNCSKLDFLPVKCDACEEIFCNEHYFYLNHNCPSSYKKDIQVPICPLCNAPVPVSRGQLPDLAVGAHIDNDCQADPVKNRKRVFTNRCSNKGCKTKEVIPVVCPDCSLNYCLKHRHPTDHKCEGAKAIAKKKALEAALSRSKNQNNLSYERSLSAVQGNLNEDEALARALALSMHTNNQMEADLALAKSLQQQEQQRVARPQRDRCTLS